METKDKKNNKKKNIIKLIILGGILLFLLAFKLVVVFQSNEQESNYEEVKIVEGKIKTEAANVTSSAIAISESFEGVIVLFVSISVLLGALGVVVRMFSKSREDEI